MHFRALLVAVASTTVWLVGYCDKSRDALLQSNNKTTNTLSAVHHVGRHVEDQVGGRPTLLFRKQPMLLSLDSHMSLKLSKKTLVVAGLPVHIYAERHHGAAPTGPVAVLFFLHGRTGSAKAIEWIVEDALKQVAQKRQGSERATELIIVTFDQRNHGERLVDAHANGAWKKGNNERHAIDMYAIQTGTAQDVSYLIDFLPSYLFPADERQVAHWLVAGKSLGGHSTWIALTHEPRLSLAVPIIACPDYMQLITNRARYSGVPLAPPYFTESLRAYIERHDPARAPYTAADASNPFRGKKVLVLSGGDDPLVPFRFSAAFVEGLEVGPNGVKKVIVQPGVEHECTPEMVQEMAEFVWEHCLNLSE